MRLLLHIALACVAVLMVAGCAHTGSNGYAAMNDAAWEHRAAGPLEIDGER